MTKEEFTPLKEFCDNNGYELLNIDHEDNDKFFVIAKKKDPWAGVEFILNKLGVDGSLSEGKIYKITSFRQHLPNTIEPMVISDSLEDVFCLREFSEPSTKSAYVDQLKKQVFEKLGDIRDGDIFNHAEGTETFISPTVSPEWDYSKEDDELFYHNLQVYKQGKWASRVPERIEIDFCWIEKDMSGQYAPAGLFLSKRTGKSIFDGMSNDKIGEIYKFMADQLEKYLNGEIK